MIHKKRTYESMYGQPRRRGHQGRQEKVLGMICQNTLYTCVLDRVFIAVKRHNDPGNSYKEKHLGGAGL